MMEILLNATTWTSREAFHAAVKDALGFPDFYGNNLDALMDCLTEISRPTTVRVIRFGSAQAALSAYADGIRRVFERAQEQNPALTVQFEK